MTAEFWGALTAFLIVLVQVIRLTLSHRKIKTNDLGCIGEMKKSIGGIEATLQEVKGDVKRIEGQVQKHLNDHITGKLK